MVVMEVGAIFPAFVAEYQKAAPNSLVEIQTTNESPAQFAQRVIRKLELVQGDLRVAIMAANAETHEDNAAARYHIARALLRVMAKRGSGEIVLTSDSTEDVRQALFALAGTLCEDGYHPSADGYRVWAHALFPAVAEAARLRSKATEE